jgi:hypothetical protein
LCFISQPGKRELDAIFTQRIPFRCEEYVVNIGISWFWPVSEQVTLQNPLTTTADGYHSFPVALAFNLYKSLIHVGVFGLRIYELSDSHPGIEQKHEDSLVSGIGWVGWVKCTKNSLYFFIRECGDNFPGNFGWFQVPGNVDFSQSFSNEPGEESAKGSDVAVDSRGGKWICLYGRKGMTSEPALLKQVEGILAK